VLVHAAKADLKSIQLEWNAAALEYIPNPLTPCMHQFSLILPGCFVTIPASPTIPHLHMTCASPKWTQIYHNLSFDLLMKQQPPYVAHNSSYSFISSRHDITLKMTAKESTLTSSLFSRTEILLTTYLPFNSFKPISIH
jgi:hypothetical protein